MPIVCVADLAVPRPAFAMPVTAAAALARICRVNGFRPRMSHTENIMVMSLISTKADTSPLAIVETMTLGRPYGSVRMMAVQFGVPCVPPIATTP